MPNEELSEVFRSPSRHLAVQRAPVAFFRARTTDTGKASSPTVFKVNPKFFLQKVTKISG